ncbi:MAG: holin family protein [Candidatus Sphingomonas colombiensis]|nr:holin family protein [Sphingomonas sp.]WEK44189.1 MAG: holin family protein [Sphingomonas sp.]
MALPDGIIVPVAGLLDRIVPDAAVRDAAKLELLRLDGTRALEQIKAQMTMVLAEANSTDPWISRARPSFLYVMYVLLLWSIPMGLIAAFRPAWATAIGHGMTAYLNAIPEPLYALFGTGYLGYTVAREWGKAKGR